QYVSVGRDDDGNRIVSDSPAILRGQSAPFPDDRGSIEKCPRHILQHIFNIPYKDRHISKNHPDCEQECRLYDDQERQKYNFPSRHYTEPCKKAGNHYEPEQEVKELGQCK